MSKKLSQKMASVFNRLAYATALGFLSWITATAPCDPPWRQIMGYAAFVLNIPLEIMNAIVPGSWHGNLVFDSSFMHNANWVDIMNFHLRFAIPAYFVLSFLPAFTMWFWQKLRRRKEPAP